MMDTSNLRFYGDAPYRVAVIHGGPGAPGSVAPVARGLAASGISTMEPLQTATTMQGQIDELADTICPYGPLILIGHSWGAWLIVLTAAAYPDLVKKLILVSPGPFEAQYAASIMPTRLSRLTESQRAQADTYMYKWKETEGSLTAEEWEAFGALVESADTYASISNGEVDDLVSCDGAAFLGVWDEADAIRRSGELLSRASNIKCPITAIHGDYDPHPYRGVDEPLSRVLKDFNFILLPKCGHEPWKEQYAGEPFFQILRDEII
jgi:pimeloyl-ACP methyl ester carboxylesterase